MNLKEVIISKQVLLLIFSIIPITLMIVLIDQLFLNSVLKHYLPGTPELFFIFVVIFTLPHVVSSSLSFFDRDYLIHYKKEIFVPSILIVLGVLLLPTIIGPFMFKFFYAYWTILHVCNQQFGISPMFTGYRGREYILWKWIGFAICAGVYFGIFVPIIGSIEIRQVVIGSSLLLFIPLIWLTLILSNKCSDIKGKYYLWLNIVTAASVLVFYAMGYPFFVILGPRVIHDVTAFIFYSAHDQNRNVILYNNLLYRATSWTKIPIILLNPILSILIAFPITLFRDNFWAYNLAVMISVFHYYTDSFTWRNTSYHRKNIIVQ